MASPFKTIGIIGKPRQENSVQTHQEIYTWLKEKSFNVLVEERLQDKIQDVACSDFASITTIGEQADLAIIIGGDGNMLGAARILSRYDIALIGVNRGNLGFLTDIAPENFQTALLKVLQGEYIEDIRPLLQVEISKHDIIKSQTPAFNESILHSGKVAHIINFDVYIDNQFAFSQRADGLIVSTQTGSTAYSLSGGGSILTPGLNAFNLIPLYPHTLSSRPLVVPDKVKVELRISPSNDDSLVLTCDGQVTLPVSPGDSVTIKKGPNQVKLVHCKDYNFYNVLRNKLGWSNKLF